MENREVKCIKNRNDLTGKDCKNCSNRHVGCHATCQLYIDNKAKSLEIKKSIHDKRRKDLDIQGHEIKVARKMEKARNSRSNKHG